MNFLFNVCESLVKIKNYSIYSVSEFYAQGLYGNFVNL